MKDRHKMAIVMGAGTACAMGVMFTFKLISGDLTGSSSIALAYSGCLIAGLLAGIAVNVFASEEHIRKFLGKK